MRKPKDNIIKVLNMFNINMSALAKVLGVSKSDLYKTIDTKLYSDLYQLALDIHTHSPNGLMNKVQTFNYKGSFIIELMNESPMDINVVRKACFKALQQIREEIIK